MSPLEPFYTSIQEALKTNRRKFWPSLLALFFTSPLLQAQSDQELLLAPWVDIPPVYQINSAGEKSGFFKDLADEIGDLAGFRVEFQLQSGARQALDGLANGEFHIVAGMIAGTVDEKTTVMSERVATTKTYLFVRTGEFENHNPTDFTNQRIGYFQALGNTPQIDILTNDQNEIVPFSDRYTLLIALLTKDIDAAVSAHEHFYLRADRMEVGGRITPLGAPLRERQRHVVLHSSKSYLLPRINAAIAQLESNGRLAELRNQYFLDLATPIPETLTVGVNHFPPYQIVESDGSYSGFAIEMIQELAERAALKIQFKTIDRDAFRHGPQPELYDILPQIGMTPERSTRMDFSAPIDRADRVSIFVALSGDTTIQKLDDLVGKRVGVRQGNVGQEIVKSVDVIDPQTEDSIEKLLQLLLDRKIDAVVATALNVERVTMSTSKASRIVEIYPPVSETLRAVAFRQGLEPIRQRLDAVIPGYLISDTYRRSYQRWLGEPEYWTSARIRKLIAGIAVMTLLALIAFAYSLQRRRYYAALELTNTKIQALNTQLIQSNKDLDNFAYIASHDLREPLRGITINANYLQRELLDRDADKRVSRIIDLGSRMDTLIADLFQFSRLGRIDGPKERIPVADVIEGSRALFTEFENKDKAQLHIDTSLPEVDMQPAHLRTVFHNLIANGLRYNTATVKYIHIGFMSKLRIKGTTVHDVFYVRDNGIGIDAAYHERIFQIFNRLNSEKTFGPGTGAGLSFVKRIIDGHGGYIHVMSSPGAGSSFYFTLPLYSQKLNETKPTTDRELSHA